MSLIIVRTDDCVKIWHWILALNLQYLLSWKLKLNKNWLGLLPLHICGMCQKIIFLSILPVIQPKKKYYY